MPKRGRNSETLQAAAKRGSEAAAEARRLRNAATDAAVESGAILAVDAENIKAAGVTYAAR